MTFKIKLQTCNMLYVLIHLKIGPGLLNLYLPNMQDLFP